MAPLQRASTQIPHSFFHFTHPNHPVTESYIAHEFICDACTTLGDGKRFSCSMCNFDLHEYCAMCPSTFGFHLHPHHVLTLVYQAGMGHVCDLCGENVDGLFYTCRTCDFDVHPLCTQVALHVQHEHHPQHLLTLRLVEPRWCMVYRQVCTSWRYRCDPCNVDVHLECAFGPLEKATETPVTPGTGYAVEATGSMGQVENPTQATGAPVTPGTGHAVEATGSMGQVENPAQNDGAVRGSRRRKIFSAVGKTVGKIAAKELIRSMINSVSN